MFCSSGDVIEFVKTEAAEAGLDLENITPVRFTFLLRRCAARFRSGGVFRDPQHVGRYFRFAVALTVPAFIDVCTVVNIMPSLMLFSEFTGVGIQTLRSWIKDTDLTGVDSEWLETTFIKLTDSILSNGFDNPIDIYKYICLGECDMGVSEENINILVASRLKIVASYQGNAINDKLANSSQIVGAITLHNDAVLTQIADAGRLAVTLQELPVLSLPTVKK